MSAHGNNLYQFETRGKTHAQTGPSRINHVDSLFCNTKASSYNLKLNVLYVGERRREGGEDRSKKSTAAKAKSQKQKEEG